MRTYYNKISSLRQPSMEDVSPPRPPGPTCLSIDFALIARKKLYRTRTSITDTDVNVYGWPSRGGMILLRQVTHLDLEFLNLDPLEHPIQRLPLGEAEDAFCRRLLLATWWDSYDLIRFVATADDAMDDLDNDLVPWPTFRERRWAKVAWPSTGGLCVAEFDTNIAGFEEEDNMLPNDAARLLMARNMDERAKLIMRIGGRFFARVEGYEGWAYIRAWEHKTDAEIGSLVKIWKDPEIDGLEEH